MISYLVCFGLTVLAQSSGPTYSAAGLTNSASNVSGPLAPNTLASLYGTGLAYVKRGLTEEDLSGNRMPTSLPGTGVRVLINGQPANMVYVSPTQINLLIPSNLIPGSFKLRVVLDGRAGPEIPVLLEETSPELFQWEDQQAAATALDWSPITSEAPVAAGEIVTLYATGLGRTVPDLPANQTSRGGAELVRTADFRLYLDGVPTDPSNIFYVGLVPGFAGLYQITFKLPTVQSDQVEVRLGFDEPMSLPGIWLPCRLR